MPRTAPLRVAALVLAVAACSPGGPGGAQTPKVVATAVESEICGLAADDAMSPAEIATLGKVLDRAHQLGLPPALLDPAHEIVSTGFATQDEIRRLRKACP